MVLFGFDEGPHWPLPPSPSETRKTEKNPEVEEEEERDRVGGLYDFHPFVFGLKCPSEVEMPPTCTVLFELEK